MKNKYLIANYHYVRDPSPDFSGIVPCSISEFERQIKWLSDNYNIVSVAEVYKAAKNKSAGNFCAITFDDTTKDQYQNAAPILDKYRASATFFVITATLEGLLPAAHKIHILLSKYSAHELIKLFNEFVKGEYFIPVDRRITQRRLHEDLATANFKEMLIMIPLEVRDKFLANCFIKLDLDEKKVTEELFMNKDEIADLAHRGFIIGGHTHHHITFDRTDADFLRAEIQQSNKIINEITGSAPTIFSFPHGRYSPTALQVLKEEGFTHGVTIEVRSVTAKDNPLVLPRYDANDVKKMIT